MSEYEGKVHGDGPDKRVVESGGEIQIKTGGKITPNSGTQPTVAALTEGAGAVGGTNDGDLPDLSSPTAALTENADAIGGTNDGDLPDLTTPDANVNAAAVREVATAVNGVVTDVANNTAAVRELATTVNGLVADVANNTASVRELAAKLNAVISALQGVGIAVAS